MFSPFERMVSLRYLRARRQEGFISVIAGFSLLGIALGVATLIIVMAVMNGFREELLSRILGLNGHLGVYSLQSGVADFDNLADTIRQVDGVVSVTPMVEGQALLTVNQVATGVVVRGLRAEDFAARPILADGIVEGGLGEFGGRRAIFVGDRLARRVGVRLGDEITLVSPQGNVTAFGTVPRMARYRIVGVFNVGMFEYDNNFVFMTMEGAQVFFRMGDTVSNLEVLLDDADRVSEVRGELLPLVSGRARLVDWQQSNASFFGALEVERNVMFLILTLIILVAAFNIISSLIMLVKDKGRDIAILRTMGATRGMIMRIFFLCGAGIGIIGTLLGLGLGLLFCLNIDTIRLWLEGLTGFELWNAEIRFLSQIPAVIDWGEVGTVTLMALGLSLLATIYPSWRAARLDPVEALRYE